MNSCPICRSTGGHKMDCENASYVSNLIGQHYVSKIQAERDRYKAALERISDNCSDTDLIIDITGAALEEVESDG